jgi:RNA polymerase sigma-70 factor (ECF subfamily)
VACESSEDIESLLAAYYPYIRRLAASVLDDNAEADDAAQETFLAACRAGAGFRGQSNQKTWLIAIAVNVCRGRLRKRRMRERLQSALEALHLSRGGEPTPERVALQNEAERRIWQAVATLDEKHRLAVILRYVNELTADEIAQALGVSEGTVYSRLHYARQKLRLLLDEANPHAEDDDGTR